MKGLILAAGRGKRLKYFTDNKPKCMNKIKGKRLIDYQIDAMKNSGIEDIYVVTGYKHQQFNGMDCTLIHNDQWGVSDMIESMKCADHVFCSGDTLVSYSDIFYNSDAVKLLINSCHDLSILYDCNWRKLWESRFENIYDDAESFRINANSFITDIGNPIDEFTQVDGQYMGLMKFSPQGWAEFSHYYNILGNKSNQITKVLNHMIKNNYMIKAVPFHGDWGEVDTIYDLQLFNAK